MPSFFVCFLVISVGEYKSVVQGVFAAQFCMNNWIFYFKLEAGATGPAAVSSSSCLSGGLGSGGWLRKETQHFCI